jgi:hypothetical protein
MSATEIGTAIFGWGLLTEDWDLVTTSRFEQPEHGNLKDWSVGGVMVDHLPLDEWTAWKAALKGPLTFSQVALLDEDANPIDARDIEPVIVPEGHYVVGVTANFVLDMPA